jgi:ABC-type Fe3+ transport system permease subunit
MFKELWRGSDPEVAPGDPNWKQRPVRPLITVWWVLYGLVPILSFSSNVQFINEVRSDTITTRELARRYRDYAATSVVYAVIAMAATVVYLMLVRDLSSRHMKAIREA